MAGQVRAAVIAKVQLDYPRKEVPGTWRDDYIAYEASKGVRHPLLDEAEPPTEAFFVWDLYWTRLRVTGFSLQELKAYQDISGEELTPWELDLLYIIHSTVEAEIEKKRNVK